VSKSQSKLQFLEDVLEKIKAWDDVAAFAKRYLSHYITAEPAQFHFELYEQMLAATKVRNKRFVCAAPRGHGKTALVSIIYPLWCICTGRKRFIVIISSSASIAEGFLRSIANELKENDLLREAFGDLVSTERWTNKEILTSSKILISAKGAKSALRGIKNLEARPDLIICDDLEDDDSVESGDQRKKLLTWFKKAVLNLPGKSSTIFVIGTILHHSSLLISLLKEWKGKRYQAISPDGAILWPSYYTREILDEIKYGTDGQAGIGSIAFESEYQNNPINPEDQIIKPDWIRHYKLDELKEISHLGIKIYSGLDPSIGEKSTSDYSAIVTVAECNGKIYVLECDMSRRSVRSTARAALRCYETWSSFPNSHYVSMAIETNAFQIVMKQQIDDLSKELGVFMPTVSRKTVTNKVARLSSISPLIECGVLYFLEDQHDLIEQLIQFPKAAHDDGPDALEMAVGLIRQQKISRIRML
jgi:predicted phage terminase large subunit-like protein